MCIRDRRWVLENKMDRGANATTVHEFVCEVMEAMVCVDRLNLPDLLSGEILCRKKQEIEEEQAKDGDVNENAPGTSFYRGRSKLSGGPCVCPALQEYGAKRLERRVNLLKSRLKKKECDEGRKKKK